MSNKAGFGKHEGGSRDFVSIVGGKFAQRTKEDDPEGVKRIIKKKDGSEKTVYELIYDHVSGFIQSIEVKEDGDFGDQLNINMENSGHKFTVTLSMAGREAKGFLCCLPNISLDEKIILFPYNFTSKDDGRQVIGLNIYQGDNVMEMKPEERKKYKILPWFSKEEPHGLPQVPEDSDKDEFKLVMKQQEIYLKKWVKKFIADNFTDAEPKKMQPNQNAETTGQRQAAGESKNATPVDKAYSAGPAKKAGKKKDEKIYGTVHENGDVPNDGLEDIPF